MRRFVSVLCAAAAVSLAPGSVRANNEIVSAYDARSSGMAYTGAAYADTATAILHNPANLTDVKRLSISISFNPTIQKLTGQVFTGEAAPPGVSKSSPFVLAPLGFVGVAYKGHPRFAVGAAAMILQANGAKYNDVPLSIYGNPAGRATIGTASAAQLAYEVRIPVAIKLTDWLSVAGGYRMTFANQFNTFKSGGVTLVDQSYGGNNFSSAQAGIMIKPMPELQFGLAYRSRTKVEMSGPSKIASAQGLISSTGAATYVAPHQFTAGVAVRLLDQKMLLTGDFKYWMFQDAYASLRDHRDAMSGNLGFEYHLTRNVPIRAGYLIGRSSTRKDSATAFSASPGLQMGGTLGSGAHFDLVDIDASVGYGHAGGNDSDVALPGSYNTQIVAFGVSASFKI